MSSFLRHNVLLRTVCLISVSHFRGALQCPSCVLCVLCGSPFSLSVSTAPRASERLCLTSPYTHQTFLRNRCHKRAIAAENLSPIETARSRGRRALLHIKQPLVGPEWPVKPHRVVQAGQLQLTAEQIVSMRQKGRIEQRHVRRIRQHTLMQRRRGGHRACGSEPNHLPRSVLTAGKTVRRPDRPAPLG